jgi:hypothetical protein
MGYQELFAIFDLMIQWSHGKEQTWFGSSINSVMTANSMAFQLRFSATLSEIETAQYQNLAWIGTDGLPGAVCTL